MPSDDQRIEAVEGAEHAVHQAAALRRGRIGVAHPGEACRQRRLAVHGDGVPRLGGVRLAEAAVAQRERRQRRDEP